MTLAEVTAIAEEAARQGRVVGLRLPLDDDEEEEPWAAPPSRRKPPIAGPLSKTIEAVIADQIYIPREGFPPGSSTGLFGLPPFRTPPSTGAPLRTTDRLGMVYEARRDNKQAAHYYRQALEFIRQRPDQYDDAGLKAVFQRLIAKLDPPAP